MSIIEKGFCHCGCGQKTRIAGSSSTRSGWVRGEPKRFLANHGAWNRKTIEERLWPRIRKSLDCWEWIGGNCHKAGYGKIIHEHKTLYAHRVSWQLRNGPIPDGLDVCHHCDNPRCVNPKHLFLGTRGDNMRDASNKGRLIGKPHPNGENHPMAKLSLVQVREILDSTDRGSYLARKYGVTHTTIIRIRRRISWKKI